MFDRVKRDGPGTRTLPTRLAMRDAENDTMKQVIDKFIEYLRYERNASPDTIREYRRDTQQFAGFLTPPGEKTLPLDEVDHRIIREYVSSLLDQGLERSSIARRLASLRTFFKFCVREKITRQNPARLVSAPKLPKRLPRVLTEEEMGGFLDSLANSALASKGKRKPRPASKSGEQ